VGRSIKNRLHAPLIANGHHLPAKMLKTMFRAKDVEHSILVSDSIALGCGTWK
jgi:N-acetylglucosamine-6-phosphate deacetylase